MNNAFPVEKHWKSHGFDCVVLMNNRMGHRCGYVGIPKTHPLYGKNYQEDCIELRGMINENTKISKRGILSIACWDGKLTSPEIVFDVHGSITYSGNNMYYPIVKHNTWWFGYDCGHSEDGCLINDNFPVRSLDYCIDECESLASQLSMVQSAINKDRLREG